MHGLARASIACSNLADLAVAGRRRILSAANGGRVMYHAPCSVVAAQLKTFLISHRPR